MGTIPRLELCLAVIAAGVGVVIASVSEALGLMPLTWEPSAVALFGGVLGGWLLRRQCVHEGGLPEVGWARKRFLRSWVVLGAGVGAAVCLLAAMTLPHYIAPSPLDGIALGGFAAVMLFPGCVWLLRQASRCVRARLGSIVAAADRRAIWGVTAVVLALISLVGLLRWSTRLPRLSGWAPMGVAAAGLFIALGVVLGDVLARRQIARLEQTRLDVLPVEADEDCPAATDLGVGEVVRGTTEVGQGYRGAGRRVPLVRGSVARAMSMVDDCVRQSTLRVGVAFAAVALHVVALIANG